MHTDYSLLDGVNTVNGAIEKAYRMGNPAIAITDHGNMYGAIEFYKQAIKTGIKPIVGCEVYVAPISMKDKDPKQRYYHLTLLAQNIDGYRNLCKMLTIANAEGFYYKPRIDLDLLQQNSKGIIALSGCMSGEVPRKILRTEYDEAKDNALRMARMMPGRYFLEIQKNGIEEQEHINRILTEISNDIKVPLVATNDVHYLDEGGHEDQDVLICIGTKSCVHDSNRMQIHTDTLWLKSPQEMRSKFDKYKGACDITLDIANMCNLEIPMGKTSFPVVKIDKKKYFSSTEMFAKLATGGLAQIFEDKFITGKDRRVYKDRLEEEMGIIIKMGFVDYFIIVWDFIKWAKDHDIPVGPGRGSAAGSLVAYALGITAIDPMPYDLLFERFLNPSRLSWPDIDVDFCENGRDKVIEYVSNKYAVEGGPAVAQIATFGKLKAKAVIRDVLRAHDVPLDIADELAKLIPVRPGISLKEAIEEEPKIEKLVAKHNIEDVFKYCHRLENISKSVGVHAAGVVISDGRPLFHYLPTQILKGKVATQYDMKCTEDVGLIKFDFLGLKNLTTIKRCIDSVRLTRGIKIDISKIPLDCKRTYKMLQSGDSSGVFQLESGGMSDVMVKLRPTELEDIIALVALYRPGPLQGGMVDSFINRKHGREAVEYEIPELEEILARTYGVCVYQEQVMQIAAKISGYSMAEADFLRKAMGKKKPEEMEEQRVRFVSGGVEKGFTRRKVEFLFEMLEKFAGYGFNKSHSVAYGLIAYQTAWLKANFYPEYMAALMTGDHNDSDKIRNYCDNCNRNNVEVKPPSINTSGYGFAVSKSNILFGLSAIKGVGDSAIDAILEERKNGEFESVYDFFERIRLSKVNKAVIESLTKSGAFHIYDRNRKSIFDMIPKLIEYGKLFQSREGMGQMLMFDVDNRPHIDIQDEFIKTEILGFEKDLLGMYVSTHPMEPLESITKLISNSASVRKLRKKRNLVVAGVIYNVRITKTKKDSKPMAIIQIEDMKGSIEVPVFPECYKTCSDLLNLGDVVFVSGYGSGETGKANVVAKKVIQPDEAVAKIVRSVAIKIKESEFDSHALDRLVSTVEECYGSSELKVIISTEKSSIEMEFSEDIMVNPIVLVDSMEKEFSDKTYSVICRR